MKVSATLSEREIQIIKLLAWGATYKTISNMLMISEKTTANHVRMIYKKLGLTKVNELSAWYFCTTYNIALTDSPITNQKLQISATV